MAEEQQVAGCPFCRDNQLLKSEVIDESKGAYLTENYMFPGNYLIIPNDHTESPLSLPDTWWCDVKELLLKIPISLIDYNLSFNIGKSAGQTVKHLHLWVIPRTADHKNAGKGLFTLLDNSIEIR
jgi:diadenosine tetraphosphate (Ap4A) HIT family hydrolase